MNILKEVDFIKGIQENNVRLITLQNENGLIAQFTNYGARWVSMWMPDRQGSFDDILLGFDTLSGYMNASEQYYGAIVGRVCGRINQAHFCLDNKEYQLASNDVYGHPVKNHLHGGIRAFHNQRWAISHEGDNAVTFSLFSPHGDEAYPGNLTVHVTYILTPENTVRMECQATTDQLTPVNLTNHAFFNLQKNKPDKSILSHQLSLRSSTIISCNEELIPTGEIEDISGTCLDFSSPRTIATSILSGNETIKKENGFSVAFALNKKFENVDWAAMLEDPESGRRMEIYTDQLSLQVYTGYFMNGIDIGKGHIPYYANAGIAVEPQGYPDAPNHRQFPSILIDENNPYKHSTTYRFLISLD